MKRFELKPDGWPCRLAECPPGPFLFKEALGFKSEYTSDKGFPEAYNEAGEYFHGDGKSDAKDQIVQPLIVEWVEVE